MIYSIFKMLFSRKQSERGKALINIKDKTKKGKQKKVDDDIRISLKPNTVSPNTGDEDIVILPKDSLFPDITIELKKTSSNLKSSINYDDILIILKG